MPVVTTLVSTYITDADGNVPSGATLTAMLVDADNVPAVQFDGGAVVPKRVQARASASDGFVQIPLWPNSRGQGGTQYRITFEGVNGLIGPPVFCAVPEVASVTLDSIVGLPPFPAISALLALLARVTLLEQQVRDGSALDVSLIPAAEAQQDGDLALIFRDGVLMTAPINGDAPVVPGQVLYNGEAITYNGQPVTYTSASGTPVLYLGQSITFNGQEVTYS